MKKSGKIFKRLMSYVFKSYKYRCITVVVLIIISVLANLQGTMFTKTLIDDYILPLIGQDSPDFAPLAAKIFQVAVFYGIGIISTYAYNRIMVNVTQGTLKNIRNDLFNKMESLPIKYFDTHAHGDIMSVYTNDIDT
ncbi:MAG: ABC transporter transmembrane domain-containing protein, partial [Coprococcus sp.]